MVSNYSFLVPLLENFSSVAKERDFINPENRCSVVNFSSLTERYKRALMVHLHEFLQITPSELQNTFKGISSFGLAGDPNIRYKISYYMEPSSDISEISKIKNFSAYFLFPNDYGEKNLPLIVTIDDMLNKKTRSHTMKLSFKVFNEDCGYLEEFVKFLLDL